MLEKKFVISGLIKTLTGLHVGAARETSEIGGMDNPVIKDPITGLPYIPGSSLKGKMRSLLEKVSGIEFNRTVGQKVNIHVCDTEEDALLCNVCRLFGSSGSTNHPARIFVRDSYLTGIWEEKFRKELLIEEKYEASIDRVTSAANPRPVERVPPGVEFEFEIIYNVEDNRWKEDLRNLFKAMKLLEDDYLGGSGSRGYGKVRFSIDSIVVRDAKFYTGEGEETKLLDKSMGVDELLKNMDMVFGDMN
jgi:CRISPR-associated protein Csm3